MSPDERAKLRNKYKGTPKLHFREGIPITYEQNGYEQTITNLLDEIDRLEVENAELKKEYDPRSFPNNQEDLHFGPD